eukprot:5329341-Pyramimonas_sp.AAC.2
MLEWSRGCASWAASPPTNTSTWTRYTQPLVTVKHVRMEPGECFVGRLVSCKYFNIVSIDQVALNRHQPTRIQAIGGCAREVMNSVGGGRIAC